MTKTTELTATVCWKAPSNLAIVKYWGKKGTQEPLNPSISFSLQQSYTQTTVSVKPAKKSGFTFRLEGEPREAFNVKIEQFLQQAAQFLPFLQNHHLTIDSYNSFPHSSGIASSASAMSALALGISSLHQLSLGKKADAIDPIMVSGLARLGSGSACRSVYGGWSIWGKTNTINESSNRYAIPLSQGIHPTFQSLHDTILLIDTTPKKVSSSLGHQLMEQHPYRQARIDQAYANSEKLIRILASGELQSFFELAEAEALSLHGLMMSSNPGYTLFHGNTITAIHRIRAAREKERLPVGFSLDAGPNIHLLYPGSHQEQVTTWINHELKELCYEGRMIHDHIGQGPEFLKI